MPRLPRAARVAGIVAGPATALRQHWQRLQQVAPVAVVLETLQKFGDDDCPTRAAALAYYALFSLFPLTIGLTALLSWLLAGLHMEADLLDLIGSYLPAGRELLRANVDEAIALRGPASLAAVAGLLWSARAVFAEVLAALNRAWAVERPRGLVLRTLVQVGLVLGVGFVFLLSLLVTAALGLLMSIELPYLGVRPFDNPVFHVLSALVPFMLSLFSFLMLYRFLPHAPVAWHDVWLPGVTAALLFESAKQGFVWYTTHVARFELVYGSLGAVVALLLWAYISGMILLAGAELSATIGRRRRDQARARLPT